MRLACCNLDNYYFNIKNDDELRDVIRCVLKANNEINKFKTYNITEKDRDIRREYSCFQIIYSEEENEYEVRIITPFFIKDSQNTLPIHEYLRKFNMPKDIIY